MMNLTVWNPGGISMICQNAMEQVCEYITFLKYIAHLAACSGHWVVHEGPLGAPAFFEFAYWNMFKRLIDIVCFSCEMAL